MMWATVVPWMLAVHTWLHHCCEEIHPGIQDFSYSRVQEILNPELHDRESYVSSWTYER